MSRSKSLASQSAKSPQGMPYKFAKTLATEDEYRHMADKLLVFAQQESSLDINAFPLSLLINPATFVGFSQDSEYFSNVYDTALRLIGARLKRLMFEGSIDRQFAMEMLPLYDPEYRRYLREKGQKDDVPAGQTKFITVNIPEYRSIPDSLWQRLNSKQCTEEKRMEVLHKMHEVLDDLP